MEADTGSWHSMTGKTGLVYNFRLMLGDILTSLLKCYNLPNINWGAFNAANLRVIGSNVYRYGSGAHAYDCRYVVTLVTDDGTVKVVGSTSIETILNWTRTDVLSILSKR